METKNKTTISLSGMGAITPNENGKAMNFEFWADDPEGQEVMTMKVAGTAQLKIFKREGVDVREAFEREALELISNINL